MPFTSYTHISEVASAYCIRIRRESFVEPIDFDLPRDLVEEIKFALNEICQVSDEGLRESLVFPILRGIWKPYRAELTLWSQFPIRFDDDLSGVPDYLIAKRSPLGSLVPENPFLLVCDMSWARCLAAMLAIRKLDDLSDRRYFGIVTNGRSWEFCMLDGEDLLQDALGGTISNLNRLAATIHGMILSCREQAARPVATAIE